MIKIKNFRGGTIPSYIYVVGGGGVAVVVWRGRESPEQTATERRPDCCKVLYYPHNINIIKYNYLSLSC